MNILITGAGGFIGTHLCNTLGKKHKLYRFYSSLKPSSDNGSYSVDLSKKNSVNDVIDKFSKKKVDVIIHLASKMSSPEQVEDLKLLQDNITITKSIVDITKSLKPEVFINFSSMSIYPNISGSFSEASLPYPQKNPDCIYGLSKYCAEVMIEFFLRNENVRLVNLRISQVYGKNMEDNRIIPYMLEELKRNNTITVFGNGQRTSNFIDIRKLIKEVEFFIEENISGTFNIGDENISYIELAKKLIVKYGAKNSIIKKENHGNKEKFILDISKLKLIHKI